MKCIKLFFSILLSMSFIIYTLNTAIYSISAQTTEIDDQHGYSQIKSGDYYSELTLDFSYDIDKAYYYSDNCIPLSFKINGLNSEQYCILDIRSNTLRIRENYKKEYTKKDNSASLLIEYDPIFNSRSESGSYSVERIDIVVTEKTNMVDQCELIIYLICLQYGTFVSYIGEEEVVDEYYRWLFENRLISDQEYSDYNKKKKTATQITKEDFDIAKNNVMKSMNEYTEPSIYLNYSITSFNSGNRLQINGEIIWSDILNISHPLKNAKITIFDRDSVVNEPLQTLYTNSFGEFSTVIDNQIGGDEGNGCDLFIRVYSESSNISVRTTSNVCHSFDTPVLDNIYYSMSNLTYVLSPCNDSKAFYIHQAGLVGAEYVKSLSGSYPTSLVIRYPYSDSQSNAYTGSYVKIRSSSYSSWDIILHEYGHFIEDYYGISNSPGGNHIIDNNLIDSFVTSGDSLYDAKDKGCRLAWAEGWATYFAISSQIQQNVFTLNVPKAGDSHYDNISDSWSRDLETYSKNRSTVSYGIGYGEGHEMAISCVLFDLADSSSTYGYVIESFDSISFGFNLIWTYSISSAATTFSDFMSYMYSNVNSTNRSLIGRILAKYGFTVTNQKTNNSTNTFYYITDNSIKPELDWTLAHGSTACVDNNYICIYSLSMTLLYTINVGTTYTHYTITSLIWSNLKNTDGFYWCIKSVPTSYPATGPYYSQLIHCYIV